MSYSAMRPDGIAMYPAAQATASDRLSFIRKVYGLVFCGVLFYAISAALPIVGMELGIPVLGDLGWMMARLHPMIAFLLLLGGSWLAHSVSMVRGLNLVGMFGFAGLFGLLSVNLLYFAMKFTGGLGIVFQALGLTCLVFGSLTGYVLLTRKDFSFLGGFLFVGMMGLIGTALIAWVASAFFKVDVSLLSTALSMVGVLLFSGYVLYDTSNMLHRYSTDMVVPAALALMVDFIILFRNILFLLLRARD